MADAPTIQRRFAVSGGTLTGCQWGEGDPEIVFMHGFGNTSQVWVDVVQPLPDDICCLAVDLRGHGDSDRSPTGYQLEMFVADAIELIGQLPQPVALVGHSLGGKVVLRAAARLPEQVTHVVVVDSGPELRLVGEAHLLGDVERVPHRYSSSAQYQAVVRQMYPLASDDQVQRTVLAELAPDPDGGFVRKLDPVFSEPRVVGKATRGNRTEMWELLKLVAQPTLVARGAASAMLSLDVATRMVEDALPNGVLVTIPRAGHVIPFDNPERLAQVMSVFLGLANPEP